MLIASTYNPSQGKVSFASLLQNKLAVRRVKVLKYMLYLTTHKQMLIADEIIRMQK